MRRPLRVEGGRFDGIESRPLGQYPADTFKGIGEDRTTSGPPDAGPPQRRRPGRLWLAIVGVALVLVGLAAFAGQDDGGGEPFNAIAAAAERTQREPGARTTMQTIVSTPVPSESLTISGHGVYDETDRSQMALTVHRPDPKGSVEMEVITDGTVMYMSSGLFGSLPGDSKWMAMDLSLAQEVDTPLPANVDAKGELALLEAVTGEVRKIGKEDVRGVPTTRYRGTVDSEEHAEEGAPLTVEAWIDGDGLVRRMRMLKPQQQGGEDSPRIDMRLEFFDFGISPEIEVPEEEEVFDATPLLRAEIDQADD